MTGNISTLQERRAPLTVQHAKTRTLMASTGEEPATFKQSVCLNDQGALAPTTWKKCQDKYDRAAFKEHLTIEGECIYHGLSQDVEEMEQELENKYGTRVVLHFKNNNTSYQKMHNLICRQAETIPRLLMVGDDPNWKYRKLAGFYMKREKANLLVKALTEFSDLGNMCGIKLTDRMGDKPMSRGRDWNSSMPDAETMLTYDNELDLTFSMPIRVMKGDSIATAINTLFFSQADSSNWAKRSRRDESNEKQEWGRLDDVRIPTNSYKTQEKTPREVPPGVPIGRGHP